MSWNLSARSGLTFVFSLLFVFLHFLVSGVHSALALRGTHRSGHTRSVGCSIVFPSVPTPVAVLTCGCVVCARCRFCAGCYPYQRKDPFVLEESPHLYVVGNQDSFSSSLVRGAEGQQVRTVCVPTFSTTGTAVLIDLHSPTLDAKPISFKLVQSE